MRALMLSLLVTLPVALAEHYSGTYVQHEPGGQAILTLVHDAQGVLTGTLRGPGGSLPLEGTVMAEGAGGWLDAGDAYLGFEAYLEGDTLTFIFFEFDGLGTPVAETAATVVFVRQGAQAPPAESTTQRLEATTDPYWRDLLAGMMLRFLSGGEWGTGTATLHLCSDGSYGYASNVAIGATVPGVDAGLTSRENHQGTWQGSPLGAGQAKLVLQATDGVRDEWLLEYGGNATYLNGERWYRVESDVCH
jgi:hypothetical protein